MKLWLARYGLLLWLALLLCAGFISTTFFGYFAARDSVRQGVEEQTLPITGDNIYSEIQKDILRPVFISSQMAHDTFLRDWMLAGETEMAPITKYLREILTKNQAISSFLVSEKTRTYYHAHGVLKQVHENDPRDRWFFRTRALQAPYEINVDLDAANRDNLTIFINYRVTDYQNRFIGVTGIGLTLDTVKQRIDSYQQRFRRSIYFVDRSGRIILSGHPKKPAGSRLDQHPGLDALAGRILANRSNPSLHLAYPSGADHVLLNARFLPELGWHLLVEQNLADEIRPLQRTLWLNLSISTGITLSVLLLALLSVRRFQTRLEKTAATDGLTGLPNRQAFDFVYHQAMQDAARTGQPACVILLDIDLFKQINDRRGHLVGDAVLREVATTIQSFGRASDTPCRWGGEEFLILLKNCTGEQAQGLAEQLRHTIASLDLAHLSQSGEPLAITASLGVTPCSPHEPARQVFERADRALYRAKQDGRNRVQFASSNGQANDQ